MRVAFNFSYYEMVIPPRCRKARETDFDDGRLLLELLNLDKLPVEEREAQFPVAYVIHPVDYEETEGKQPVVIRGYTPTKELYSAERNGRIQLSDLLSGTIDWKAIQPYGRKTSAETIADIKEWAKSRIIFNGEIWVCRNAEPAYEVKTFGLGGNHGGTAVFIEWVSAPSGTAPECYFRADEYEEVREQAIRVAERRGDTESAERFRSEEYFAHGYIEVQRGGEFSRLLSKEQRDAVALDALVISHIAEMLEMENSMVPQSLKLQIIRRLLATEDFAELMEHEKKERIKDAFRKFVISAAGKIRL